MSNYDDYITGSDKPFAENINDALLLSNVFDLTVPIQVPTMFNDGTWIDTVGRRKCGVAIVTLKEQLPSGVSISTVDGKSVLTGTGTVKLGFYPNFNSFGKIKSISWENTGTVQINLKTVNNTTILSDISKGIIENSSTELRKLQEIVIEIVFTNATLKSLTVTMENKSQDRYGATVGITDVTGLESRLSNIEGKDTVQDGRLTALEGISSQLFDLVYPVGSIYMSVNSTSPATLFGGTWQQLKDKFLLSAGGNYSAGATGGASTVTLTQDQMPRHNHSTNAHSHRTNDSGEYFVTSTQPTANNTRVAYSSSGDRMVDGVNTTNSIFHHRTTTNSQAPSTKYSGGTGSSEAYSDGSAHENMPPYLAVYMWKRTA